MWPAELAGDDDVTWGVGVGGVALRQTVCNLLRYLSPCLMCCAVCGLSVMTLAAGVSMWRAEWGWVGCWVDLCG